MRAVCADRADDSSVKKSTVSTWRDTLAATNPEEGCWYTVEAAPTKPRSQSEPPPVTM
jgi:hypothetical protein